MRAFSGLAAAAVLALTTLGAQAALQPGQAADAGHVDRITRADAVAALESHPAGLDTAGVTYAVSDRIVDADGTTHTASVKGTSSDADESEDTDTAEGAGASDRDRSSADGSGDEPGDG